MSPVVLRTKAVTQEHRVLMDKDVGLCTGGTWHWAWERVGLRVQGWRVHIPHNMHTTHVYKQ